MWVGNHPHFIHKKNEAQEFQDDQTRSQLIRNRSGPESRALSSMPVFFTCLHVKEHWCVSRKFQISFRLKKMNWNFVSEIPSRYKNKFAQHKMFMSMQYLEMRDEVPPCTEKVHYIPWGTREGNPLAHLLSKDTVKWETMELSMAVLRTGGWRLRSGGVLSSDSKVRTGLSTWQLQGSRFEF